MEITENKKLHDIISIYARSDSTPEQKSGMMLNNINVIEEEDEGDEEAEESSYTASPVDNKNRINIAAKGGDSSMGIVSG